MDGKTVYPSFSEVRWSGTPAPTALDFITQRPANYYEKSIGANRLPVKLYFIAKCLQSKDLYVHNAFSYKSRSKNVQFKKEQKLENKEHIITIKITGENTDTYLLTLCLKPQRNKPPNIEIKKCNVLAGINRDIKLVRNRFVEEV